MARQLTVHGDGRPGRQVNRRGRPRWVTSGGHLFADVQRRNLARTLAVLKADVESAPR